MARIYSNGGADDDRTMHGPFDGERELAISKMETKARCPGPMERSALAGFMHGLPRIGMGCPHLHDQPNPHTHTHIDQEAPPADMMMNNGPTAR